MSNARTYLCRVLEVRDDSFLATVDELNEQIECLLDEVDPEQVSLVKPGAKFSWIVNKYRKVISFQSSESMEQKP